MSLVSLMSLVYFPNFPKNSPTPSVILSFKLGVSVLEESTSVDVPVVDTPTPGGGVLSTGSYSF